MYKFVMTTDIAERRFCARFSDLPELLATARSAALAAGFDEAGCLRIELVLEEIFSNSIRHGYGRECDEPVWLAGQMLPDGLRLVYRDAAPCFDPLHDAQLPADGRLGGVGRVLVTTIPRSASYARDARGNCLSLEFGRGGVGAAV